jgi:hypothetical protein
MWDPSKTSKNLNLKGVWSNLEEVWSNVLSNNLCVVATQEYYTNIYNIKKYPQFPFVPHHPSITPRASNGSRSKWPFTKS